MTSPLGVLLLVVVAHIAYAGATCSADTDCLSVAARLRAAVSSQFITDPAGYVSKECAKIAVQ